MTELLAGLSLGLGAGVAPGPLLTLVMTSTLERGFGAGLRVAMAPFITDAPIIALTVTAVSTVNERVLQALGVAGGAAIIAMGLWSIVTVGRHAGAMTHVVAGPADLWRGVVANALSPHPWLFWVGVGAPLLVSVWRSAPGLAAAFLLGFYGLLVGSKVAVAAFVARARQRLNEEWRRRLVVIGGTLLMIGGAVLVWEAAAGRL